MSNKSQEKVEELFSKLEEQVFTKGIWNEGLKKRIFEITQVRQAFEEQGLANTDSHSRVTRLGAVWSAIDSGNPIYAEKFAQSYIELYSTAQKYAKKKGDDQC